MSPARAFNEDDLVHCLQQLGYHAERIPEAPPKEQPDVIAWRGNETLLVELKRKEDDNTFATTIDQMGDGDHYHDSRALGQHGPWSRIVNKAVSQLQQHTQSSAAIKLLAVNCEGMDPKDQAEQLQQSLYGLRAVTHDNSPIKPPECVLDIAAHRPIATLCYHFAPSLFAFHRRTLAGVLVHINGEWRLFANALATDHARLRASHLYAIARDHQALIDPADRATLDPDDYVIDPRQDGETDASVLTRLARKSGISNPQVWNEIRRHRAIGKFPGRAPPT